MQLEVVSITDAMISVRRDDHVGETLRVRHNLVRDQAAPRPLAEPRAPSESELSQIMQHVNERLRQPGVQGDRESLLQFLKEATRTVGRACAPSAPGASAASPRHGRVAASTGFMDLGGAYGQLSSNTMHWRWTAPHWSMAITCDHPARLPTAPTERELGRVHSLLVHLLTAEASGRGQRWPSREEARELLHITLLRLQLLDPPPLNLCEFLARPPPRLLWFTTPISSQAPSLQSVSDPKLLDDDHWLEENELLALVARTFLGETPQQVLETLRGGAELEFSEAVHRLLEHDEKPCPSQRAAQLVVLAGGGPAMRFLEAVVGSVGITQVLREASTKLAIDGVVMNTSAAEYFELVGGAVRLRRPHVYYRCNAPRKECSWSLGKPAYCDDGYIPTTGAVAAFHAHGGTTTTATDAFLAAAASSGCLAARAPLPRSSRSRAACAATAAGLPVSGRQLRSTAATATSAATTATTAATSATTTTAVPATATTATTATNDVRCWEHGSYFGCAMRDLMGTLHQALDNELLDGALKAACSLNVVARNGYNTRFIAAELGPGCEVFLNAHGTKWADGREHRWLEKLSRAAEPFTPSDEALILSVSDALAVSQSPATFSAQDEGSRLARLYANSSSEDIKENEVPAHV